MQNLKAQPQPNQWASPGSPDAGRGGPRECRKVLPKSRRRMVCIQLAATSMVGGCDGWSGNRHFNVMDVKPDTAYSTMRSISSRK